MRLKNKPQPPAFGGRALPFYNGFAQRHKAAKYALVSNIGLQLTFSYAPWRLGAKKKPR
jgi:hypothetical protein